MASGNDKIIAAADEMDWVQVFGHGGEPCFHLCDDGRFCGRAKWWAGHEGGSSHAFVSLADLLRKSNK